MYSVLNTVAINGSRVLYGYGAAAAMSLEASGFNNRQKFGVSTAAVTELFAVGTMKKAVGGIGAAALIDLQATGTMKRAAAGRGVAALTDLSAYYGIPKPKYIPQGVTTGHPSREIRVPADGRIVDISPEGES